MVSYLSEIQQHLKMYRTTAVQGEFFRDSRLLINDKFSQGLWLRTENGWKEIVTKDRKVTDLGKKLRPPLTPAIKEGSSLYRVVNKNQLYYDDQDNILIQLPPSISTLLFIFYLSEKAADSINQSINNMPDQWFKNQLLHFSEADFLKQLKCNLEDTLIKNAALIHLVCSIALFDYLTTLDTSKRKQILATEGKEKILSTLGFDAKCIKLTPFVLDALTTLRHKIIPLSELIQDILLDLPHELRQLIYIYNRYLGGYDVPRFLFGKQGLEFPPDIVNYFCDVRFFTTSLGLSSCLNVILPQAVFRGLDLYRRPVKGANAIYRLEKYFILEFPYSKSLQETGKIDLTNYERLKNALDDLLAEKMSGARLCGSISKTNKRFFKEVLPIWGNIYHEVRTHGALIPSRILKIHWELNPDCPENSYESPCEICSRFVPGEILWEYENKEHPLCKNRFFFHNSENFSKWEQIHLKNEIQNIKNIAMKPDKC